MFPSGRVLGATRVAVASAIIALTAAVACGQDDMSSFEAAFARTAQADGKPYAIGRDLLGRQGEPILPLLEKKAKSGNWRERDLAQALLLRIKKPAQCARWCEAILRTWDSTMELRPDGLFHVKFSPERREQPAKPLEPLSIDKEAIPVILDILRETARQMNGPRDYGETWTRALMVLKHFAPVECVEPLIHHYGHGGTWKHWPEIVDVLAAVGKPALPALRQVIRDCPTQRQKDQADPEPDTWARMVESVGAAMAIGRIGDPESVPILIEKLNAATEQEQVETFCQVLGRLRAPDGVPAVFKQLLRVTESIRQPRRRLAGNEPEYGGVRQGMTAFGPVARPFLADRAAKGQPVVVRIVAAGLLLELDHADETAAFYGQCGRAVLEHRMREDEDRERPPDLLGTSRRFPGRRIRDRPSRSSGRAGLCFPAARRSPAHASVVGQGARLRSALRRCDGAGRRGDRPAPGGNRR